MCAISILSSVADADAKDLKPRIGPVILLNDIVQIFDLYAINQIIKNTEQKQKIDGLHRLAKIALILSIAAFSGKPLFKESTGFRCVTTLR